MARRRSKEAGGFEEALALARRQSAVDELTEKKKKAVERKRFEEAPNTEEWKLLERFVEDENWAQAFALLEYEFSIEKHPGEVADYKGAGIRLPQEDFPYGYVLMRVKTGTYKKSVGGWDSFNEESWSDEVDTPTGFTLIVTFGLRQSGFKDTIYIPTGSSGMTRDDSVNYTTPQGLVIIVKEWTNMYRDHFHSFQVTTFEEVLEKLAQAVLAKERSNKEQVLRPFNQNNRK